MKNQCLASSHQVSELHTLEQPGLLMALNDSYSAVGFFASESKRDNLSIPNAVCIPSEPSHFIQCCVFHLQS